MYVNANEVHFYVFTSHIELPVLHSFPEGLKEIFKYCNAYLYIFGWLSPVITDCHL